MNRVTLRGRKLRQYSDKAANSDWIKSSISAANGDCVEVANLPGGFVGVRHSMDVQGPVLQFTPSEWEAFLGGVRNGEFDQFSGRSDSQ